MAGMVVLSDDGTLVGGSGMVNDVGGAIRLDPDLGLMGAPGLTVGQFWSWAYSDILSNRNRAIFAEFLVGAALSALDHPRVEWDAVDLRYRGRGIEVKASGYLQRWAQTRPSTIRFDIAEKRPDNTVPGSADTAPRHAADCFVFCLYTATTPARAVVTDLADWLFYIVPTSSLPATRSLGLAALETLAEPVDYSGLRASVDAVIDGLEVVS